jgi:dipeptidyl aminopeptidase/acylaminoacyl peptidase
MTSTAPYGSWPSRIRVEDAVGGSIALAEVWTDGDDILWVEGRPAEGGRRVVVRRTADGSIHDVTPSGFNVRSRVHEYGGGSLVVRGGLVVFSSFADGRLYAQRTDGSDKPRAITPESPGGPNGWRYADLRIDQSRARILAIREDHAGGDDAVNTIVAVPLDGGEPQVLIDGHDFFAAPRVSPDGRRLAWLSWDHPNMPWDGTTLWVAALAADGTPIDPERVAGGPTEWISQPRWSPDGTLWFLAERDEWAAVMSLDDYRAGRGSTMDAEFAPPEWVFDRPTYAFLGSGAILAAARSDGRDHLWRIDSTTGSATELDVPFTEIAYVVAHTDAIAFIGGQPAAPSALVRLDAATGTWEEIRRASNTAIAREDISIPEPITFPTTGGETAHALYYPPVNPDVTAPAADRPPLLVRSHGGPTASASSALNPTVQFMTSRGIAVVDVDYGGSTGYGRSYRRRLEGGWGVVDLDDCIAAARFLVDRGDADPERLGVTGGSAGGYTTLAALTFRDVFAAGISYFGIGDLETFVRDTHKFESRYLDRLVAPYPAGAAVYRERSPIHYVDRLSRPVLLLQGLDDRVVPPNQAQDMADALRAKGIPYAYLGFEGEGHGFRGLPAQKRALETELSFLGQVFGFTPADEIEPIELVRPDIENQEMTVPVG